VPSGLDGPDAPAASALQAYETEWVIVALYVPANAPAGIGTPMDGFQVAVLTPDTAVAVCTVPGVVMAVRLMAVTVDVPTTHAVPGT
jgi:hypothetical protein